MSKALPITQNDNCAIYALPGGDYAVSGEWLDYRLVKTLGITEALDRRTVIVSRAVLDALIYPPRKRFWDRFKVFGKLKTRLGLTW